MMSFQCAAVNSVAYRSGWQRLQWMAYNVAPESVLVCTGFSGAAGGPAETRGAHTAQMIEAVTKTPIPARSRGFSEPNGFMISFGCVGAIASFPTGNAC